MVAPRRAGNTPLTLAAMAGVFIYVQHLLGSGHLHRVARIANELTSTGTPVTLCSGGEPVPAIVLAPGVRFVQLEPLHCAAHDFTTLLDRHGRPMDERVSGTRRAQLSSALAGAAPRVALIESYPFARRQMRFELRPLLEQLREHSVTTACSVRDILQVKEKPQRAQETLTLLADYFSAVLVHGDRRVVALQATFRDAARIPCAVHYTGYVAAPPVAPREGPAADVADIIVSAGGGAVGYPLFRAALAACRAGCQADKRWRFLLGSGLHPEQAERLRAEAPANASVTPASGTFTTLLRECELSISQAGYNTVVDVLQAGCRSLLVPYAQRGEMEQTLRARRLHEMGLLASYDGDELDAARLAACVDEGMARPRADTHLAIDLHGARNSAALLQSWIAAAAR